MKRQFDGLNLDFREKIPTSIVNFTTFSALQFHLDTNFTSILNLSIAKSSLFLHKVILIEICTFSSRIFRQITVYYNNRSINLKFLIQQNAFSLCLFRLLNCKSEQKLNRKYLLTFSSLSNFDDFANYVELN